jgi:hypothetical protein
MYFVGVGLMAFWLCAFLLVRKMFQYM